MYVYMDLYVALVGLLQVMHLYYYELTPMLKDCIIVWLLSATLSPTALVLTAVRHVVTYSTCVDCCPPRCHVCHVVLTAVCHVVTYATLC